MPETAADAERIQEHPSQKQKGTGRNLVSWGKERQSSYCREQDKALVPHWSGLVLKLTTASFLYLYSGSTIVRLFWCIFTGNLIFAVINPCWLKRSKISTDILSQFVIFLLEMNCQQRWLQSTFLLQRMVKKLRKLCYPSPESSFLSPTVMSFPPSMY